MTEKFISLIWFVIVFLYFDKFFQQHC